MFSWLQQLLHQFGIAATMNGYQGFPLPGFAAVYDFSGQFQSCLNNKTLNDLFSPSIHIIFGGDFHEANPVLALHLLCKDKKSMVVVLLRMLSTAYFYVKKLKPDAC
jgi:hypothetical protein